MEIREEYVPEQRCMRCGIYTHYISIISNEKYCDYCLPHNEGPCMGCTASTELYRKYGSAGKLKWIRICYDCNSNEGTREDLGLPTIAHNVYHRE